MSTRLVREQQEEQVHRLMKTIHEQRWVDEAKKQRLLPLASCRLRQNRDFRDPDVARGVDRAVWGIAQTARAQSLLTGRLIEALADANISAIPIKGPLLAQRLLGDPTFRSSQDIDILVSADSLLAAGRALALVGYQAQGGTTSGTPKPLLHSVLVHPSLSPVELHHRIHWYEHAFSRHLLSTSTARTRATGELSAIDELVSLLLFYARDGLRGLRFPADIAALWDARGNQIETGALGAVARSYPQLRRALVTAAVMAQTLVGLPAEQLLAPANRPSRQALVLSDSALREDPKQAVANVHLVNVLLAEPAGRVPALWRALIRPSAEPVERPRLRLKRMGRRIGHCLRVLRRFALAYWSMWSRR